MAVVSVNEKQGRAWKDGDGRHYTRAYIVELDNVADGEVTALDADDGVTAIPEYGAMHPNNAYARCSSVETQETESRLIWRIEARYDTITWGGRRSPDTEPLENPLDEPADISWGASTRTEAVYRDKDGNPVLNSAKDWFDPPLEQERYDLALTVSRNEQTYSPSTAHDYEGCVNSDSTTICGLAIGPRRARLIEWSGNRQERNGVSYWRVSYKLEFRKDADEALAAYGWDRVVLDRGVRAIDPTSSKKGPILEKQTAPGEYAYTVGGGGMPVTDPMRLDGAGGILDPLTEPGGSAWLSFRICREKAFAALGLNI